MPRSAILGLVCLSLFLLLFPIGLGMPGAVVALKADEGAYYLMALSLAHDRDLEMDEADLERAFDDFPYRFISNLILMTDDGWHTAFYGKPYVYPLFAAPFAWLGGAKGLLVFNMLLMVGMIWLGALRLGRSEDGPWAAGFAAVFFLLSSAFAYVFWLQPEVFNMAAIAACLFLGLGRPAAKAREGEPDELPGPWQAFASGLALALAVYNKPVFAAFALPVVGGLLLRRRFRAAGAWVLGLAFSLAAVAGGAMVLTGHATPYLGVVRQGATLCEPGVMPVEAIDEEAEPEAVVAGSNSPTGNAWSWLFRIPRAPLRETAENVGYFLWGRHTGFLLYLPFGALALVLFLLHGRRSAQGWLLAGALVVVAAFFLLFIPFNWHGGGGFIGNRYFVSVYPAFFFLVTKLRPRFLLAPAAAAAGLLLAPVLFTPLGASEPEPTLQRHVRGLAYRAFPLELSLRNVPGYHRLPAGALRIVARKDQVLPQGEPLWIRSADSVELTFLSPAPIAKAVFLVENLATRNRVRLELAGAEVNLDFAAGREARRVVLEPAGPSRTRSEKGSILYVYRLEVAPSTGRVLPWTRTYPPSPCPNFVGPASVPDTFPVGAVLTYLGDGADLDANVFELTWQAATVPAVVDPGSRFKVPVTLRNTSAAAWRGNGAARVKLSSHWRRLDGPETVFDGLRTELPGAVAPGAEVALELEVEAPATAGRYRLELDPVYEFVAWFSEKGVAPFVAEVVVGAPPAVGEVPP